VKPVYLYIHQKKSEALKDRTTDYANFHKFQPKTYRTLTITCCECQAKIKAILFHEETNKKEIQNYNLRYKLKNVSQQNTYYFIVC